MTQFHIIETSIDVDNYLHIVLCDEHNNVQMFNIHTCNRDDDINIIVNDDDDYDNSFQFNMQRMTHDRYNALIR